MNPPANPRRVIDTEPEADPGMQAERVEKRMHRPTVGLLTPLTVC
jgi:hypothetical protein